MNISTAKTEMSLNTGELEALKQRTVTDRIKPLALEDLDGSALKAKAEEMWKTIILLETSKYDLHERCKRQEYDVRALWCVFSGLILEALLIACAQRCVVSA